MAPTDDNDTELYDHFAVGEGSDILVVDDYPANLLAFETALEPIGRKVIFAQSGPEALTQLLAQDFALILLDVAMPGMDGFETARMIRSRARNRATPIIFITGHQWEDAQVLQSYELGAFDFIIKPVRTEVLQAKVRLFVELQERTLQLRQAQARAHQHELSEQQRRFESETMERQVRQMEEADRRKDEFLAILAHELRNPLQPLQTSVELLRKNVGQPVSGSLVEIMERRLLHINRLVDDLLDVARFTARKLELRRRLVDLRGVVDEGIASCRALLDERRHQLNVRGPEGDALPMVHGDPTRLIQVVCNLLTNAAKYTDPGGQIDVTWGLRDGEVFICVADNGRGIGPDALPTIFEMFVRERVAKDGSEGLGLGLGLARRLVELHGGTIEARSAGRGQGSSFEVRLPLASGTAIAHDENAQDSVGSVRVLVCDDSQDVRDLVADLLRSYGHEVRTVGRGEAAIHEVVHWRPDVALIDIGLPDLSGHDVARRISAQLGAARPRLIAMTGYGQASDRAAALDAGFDEHLKKPANAEQILAVLSRSATAQ